MNENSASGLSNSHKSGPKVGGIRTPIVAVTPIQVLAATRFVVPALEIIDSRIEGWKIKLCDTIVDNASSARVVSN